MRIDGRVIGEVSLKEGGGKLDDDTQTRALLAAVRKNSGIQ